MLTVFLGLGLPSWRGSQAHALVRETAKQMPVEFDLQAELLRHTEAAARMSMPSTAPLAPPASPTALGSTTGLLKAALLVTAGGVALVTAMQWRSKPAPLASGTGASAQLVVAQQEATFEAPQAAHEHPLSAGAPEAVLRPVARTLDDAQAHKPDLTRDAAVLARGPTHRGASAAREHAANTGAFTGSLRSGNRADAASRRTATSTPGEAAEALEADPRDPGAAREERQQEPAAKAPIPPTSQQLTSNIVVVEAQALGRAESLLQKDPAQALAIVRKVAQQSSADYLAEERRYIEVMALYALDRRVDAKRAADAVLTAYPQSVFRERVTRARN
jgi:hypothetical protein